MTAVETGDDGTYLFPTPRIGRYHISAEEEGFAAATALNDNLR